LGPSFELVSICRLSNADLLMAGPDHIDSRNQPWPERTGSK
jgi:hypothetical protein